MYEESQQLKKQLVKVYGSNLIDMASFQTPLNVIKKNDSIEERRSKQIENERIIAAREEEYRLRENELVDELEKLMRRVKSTNAHDENQVITRVMQLSTTSAIASTMVCEQCGNKDTQYFLSDELRGDTICLGKGGKGCGAVVYDHEVNQGAEKRRFENEEDRNHFGPAPNRLMPDVVNLETNLSVSLNGRDNSTFKRLQRIRNNVELNLSTLGRDDRRTREGYKVLMKRKAFALLEEIGGNFNVHQTAINRAKDIFACYRDAKEAVQQNEGIVLACLVISYEQYLENKIKYAREPSTSQTWRTPLQQPRNIIPTKPEYRDQNHEKILTIQDAEKDPAILSSKDISFGKFNFLQLQEFLRQICSYEKAITQLQDSLKEVAENFPQSAFNIEDLLVTRDSTVSPEEALLLEIVSVLLARVEKQLVTIASSSKPSSEDSRPLKRKKNLLEVSNSSMFRGTIQQRVKSFQSKKLPMTDSNLSNKSGDITASQGSMSSESSQMNNNNSNHQLNNENTSSDHGNGDANHHYHNQNYSAGKLFLKLDLLREINEFFQERLQSQATASTVSTVEKEVVEVFAAFFTNAIQRKSQYEKAKLLQLEKLNMEKRRLAIEENNAIAARKRKIMELQQEQEKGKSKGNTTSSATGSEIITLASEPIDLEQLLGAEFTVKEIVIPSNAPEVEPEPAIAVKPEEQMDVQPVISQQQEVQNTEVEAKPVQVEVKIEESIIPPVSKTTVNPPTTTAPAVTKKVGARPRPKIVIK